MDTPEPGANLHNCSDLTNTIEWNIRNIEYASKQRGNEYDLSSTGPYSVHIMSTIKKRNIGNLHPMSIRAILDTLSEDIETMKVGNEEKIAVLCSSAVGANRLANNPQVASLNWIAFIPSYKTTRTGVVEI